MLRNIAAASKHANLTRTDMGRKEHIKPRETEPIWYALLMQVASCKNEDVMAGLDGTLKIKADCMERFAQAVARECKKIADDSDYGPIQHHIGDQISARFGLGE